MKKSELESLKNVGPAVRRDLQLLGIERIEQLIEETPDHLYKRLQEETATQPDPCMWDVFAAIIHEARTGEKLPWWHWTKIRKGRGPINK